MKAMLRKLARPKSSRTVVARRDLPRTLGDAARARRDWESAARHYALHLEDHPADFPIWVQFGHALKESGQLERAEIAYIQALRLNGYCADLWLNRGHLSKLRGDRRAARARYARSHALDRNGAASAELKTLQAATAPAGIAFNDDIGDGLADEPAGDNTKPIRALDVYNGTFLNL